jgi:hypothetical protein
MSVTKQSVTTVLDALFGSGGKFDEDKLGAVLDSSLAITWDGKDFDRDSYIAFVKAQNEHVAEATYEIKAISADGDQGAYPLRLQPT